MTLDWMQIDTKRSHSQTPVCTQVWPWGEKKKWYNKSIYGMDSQKDIPSTKKMHIQENEENYKYILLQKN